MCVGSSLDAVLCFVIRSDHAIEGTDGREGAVESSGD
jgi:hypothetical protein